MREQPKQTRARRRTFSLSLSLQLGDTFTHGAGGMLQLDPPGPLACSQDDARLLACSLLFRRMFR